jgi:DNA-binding ferritin-like protein
MPVWSPQPVLQLASPGRGRPESARLSRRTNNGRAGRGEVVKMTEKGGDVATADLATERLEVHEKTAWMLRATAS